MTSSNILNLGVERTVRELDSLRLMNFAWYCDNYPEKLEENTRLMLSASVKKELYRRKIRGESLYEDLVV